MPDFRFSVIAVWSCGSRCKLASSSSTNQVGRGCRPCCINRSTSRSSHQLTSGMSGSRVSGVLGRNTHPCRSRDHAVVLQRDVVSCSRGRSWSASATMLNEAMIPLRCCGRLRGDHRRVGRPAHAPIELVLVAEHPGQLLQGEADPEEMGKEATRALGEELLVLVAVGKERGGDGQGLGVLTDFVRWIPVGAPRVERIEDDVAPVGCVELRREFARGIVDDGRVATRVDLLQQLPDEA